MHWQVTALQAHCCCGHLAELPTMALSGPSAHALCMLSMYPEAGLIPQVCWVDLDGLLRVLLVGHEATNHDRAEQAAGNHSSLHAFGDVVDLLNLHMTGEGQCRSLD